VFGRGLLDLLKKVTNYKLPTTLMSMSKGRMFPEAGSFVV
jgi:hypothetical protein